MKCLIVRVCLTRGNWTQSESKAVTRAELEVILLQAQHPVNAFDYEKYERLPGDQPADPVEQSSVQHMRFLPATNRKSVFRILNGDISGYSRVTKHFLQIDLLFAIGTRLLLAHNAPASYAELVEYMITG